MRYALKWYRICLVLMLPFWASAQIDSIFWAPNADLRFGAPTPSDGFIWAPNDGFIALDEDGNIIDSIWTSGATIGEDITPPPPHPAEILKLFDQPNSQVDVYKETGSTIAPWLSWRLAGQQSIAINIICNWEELQVLIADKWILSHDLWLLWTEAGLDNMETLKRGNRVQFHRPGQYYPMQKYYTISRSTDSNVLSLPLGDNGWWGRVVSGGILTQGKLPIVIKQVGSEYILSAAIIMKQTSY